MQFELLQENAEVITVQRDVQQGKLFQVTMFYVRNQHFQEEIKMDEKFGFVNEQQFALQDNRNEGAM